MDNGVAVQLYMYELGDVHLPAALDMCLVTDGVSVMASRGVSEARRVELWCYRRPRTGNVLWPRRHLRTPGRAAGLPWPSSCNCFSVHLA
jgi:hypothetical protein